MIDEANQPISYQEISIDIDGVKYFIFTDENGIAIIEHELINSGQRIIFASYGGNENYYNSFDEFLTNVESNETEAKNNTTTDIKNSTKQNKPKYAVQSEKTKRTMNNDTKTTIKNPTEENIAKSSVHMKKTGMPIAAIFTVFIISLGLIIRKKQ